MTSAERVAHRRRLLQRRPRPVIAERHHAAEQEAA